MSIRLPQLSYHWNSDIKFFGLIFFAQTMDEMLFHFTFDSYKAPISNVPNLILELNKALDETDEVNLGKDGTNRYLNPVCEELVQKFSKDIIAKKNN